MKLYQKIARTCQAMLNSDANGNDTWSSRHTSTLEEIQREHFPHGSGLDGEVYIDMGRTGPQKLIITFEYHFMDDHGYYDGWAAFDLIVTPDLGHGFDLKIKWYSHENDKYKVQKYKPVLDDYLHELWHEVLNKEY